MFVYISLEYLQNGTLNKLSLKLAAVLWKKLRNIKRVKIQIYHLVSEILSLLDVKLVNSFTHYSKQNEKVTTERAISYFNTHFVTER